MCFIPARREEKEKMGPNSLCFEMYPSQERKLLEKLVVLFTKWQTEFRLHEKKSGSIIHGLSADDMTFDGFYPYYLSQDPKILFVGREARDISGMNYI